MRRSVGVLEVFGLRPLGRSLAQCVEAIRGDEHSEPSRFGVSSLRIFKPQLSLPLWLGMTRGDRRVPIYNLPNRIPEARDEGYSVRVTHCRDYRGRQLTYDGHVGTDFAVPAGTEVAATAPGRVIRVSNEMQRGGLKVWIDHGSGFLTGSNHLARALVQPGDSVARGEPIGLSGMSSVDGVLFFPWLAPHLHLNVLLNGEPVDPFAKPGEVPLWRGDNYPVPHRGDIERTFSPTRWSRAGVERTLASCKNPTLRRELEAEPDPDLRACFVAIERLVRMNHFTEFPPLVDDEYPRRPLLSLPFRPEDYAGVVYPDEL